MDVLVVASLPRRLVNIVLDTAGLLLALPWQAGFMDVSNAEYIRTHVNRGMAKGFEDES